MFSAPEGIQNLVADADEINVDAGAHRGASARAAAPVPLPRLRERRHRRVRRLIIELTIAAALYVTLIYSEILQHAGVETPFIVLIGFGAINVVLGTWLVRRELDSEARLARRNARGADAEDVVDLELRRRLDGKGFSVLRSIPVTGEDADHVIIGPTGIWVVETKAAGGTAAIDQDTGGLFLGRGRPDPLPGVERVARKLRAALTAAEGTRRAPVVHAAICLPNGKIRPEARRIQRPSDIVFVDRPGGLVREILARRRCLSDTAIRRWTAACEALLGPARPQPAHRSFRLTPSERTAALGRALTQRPAGGRTHRSFRLTTTTREVAPPQVDAADAVEEPARVD
jgi:hypothetical protein